MLTALRGATFVVKDVIDLAGYPTGSGNPDRLAEQPPATVHAVVVEQLLAAGARCFGKSQTDELAFGLLGENHFYGTPLNPKAPDRVPGGSSSGSASAVALGEVDFALGTDTGGSVRVPASNCGLYGFRPSHGRISLAGVQPLAPSFDTVGLLAAEPRLFFLAAETLLATSLPKEPQGEISSLEEAFSDSSSDVAAALPNFKPLVSLQELGTTFEELTSTYCALQWSEAWSCWGSWIESRSPHFGPRVAKNFALARTFAREKIQENARRRVEIRRALDELLRDGRIIAMPTTPDLAPLKGSIGTNRSQESYFQRLLGFTALAGLGALPQITLPIGAVGSVPIGLSLLAAHGRDELLLKKAQEFLPGP